VAAGGRPPEPRQDNIQGTCSHQFSAFWIIIWAHSCFARQVIGRACRLSCLRQSQGKADSVKIASFALAKVIPVYTKAPAESQYALLQSSAEAVAAAQTPVPDSEQAMEAVYKALMVSRHNALLMVRRHNALLMICRHNALLMICKHNALLMICRRNALLMICKHNRH
jgi:hypothetical protein